MPGAGLTAVGTLSYNGFTFDGATVVTVRAEFVYDQAGRTVTHTRYHITASGILAATVGGDIESEMTNLLRRLSKPGGILTLSNRGFGSSLSTGLNRAFVRDAKWGPKPEVLEWESIGSSSAVHFTWSCTAAVMECGDARYAGVSAMNFQVSFAIDASGDTTRTIDGYLEIAQTWQGNANPGSVRFPPDSADKYRELISPRPPRGYKRIGQNWVISADRSRVDFSITDQQIPTRNPLPPGVTDAQGSFSVGWNVGRAGQSSVNLDVTATPAPHVSPSQAWLIFLTIFNNRTAILRSMSTGMRPFVTSFSAQEDIWGRPCSFHVGYTILADPGNMLTLSGIWAPLGTDHQRWYESTFSNVYHQRGSSKLYFHPEQDAIVDLCGGAVASTESPVVEPKIPAPKFTKLKNTKPKPDRSYLRYRAGIHSSRQQQLTRHSPIQSPYGTNQAPSSGSENPPPADPPAPKPTDSAAFSYPQLPNGAAKSIIQTRGTPDHDVLFYGEAIRAGYPIPRPELRTVGGKVAHEVHSDFVMEVVGEALGVPLYAAKWAVYYALDASPGQVDAPTKYEGGLAISSSGAII